MNCHVTCGRPTRMSAEAFARMCAARRDDGGGRCAECGGRRKSWPDELTTIEGGKAMASKTIKEQIAEALAPVKAELEDREARVAVLEDTLAGTEEALAGAKARIAELEAELSEARGIIAHQAGEVSASRREMDVDLSASIYRDALADFAIRVLSGGVAVSFHEARP